MILADFVRIKNQRGQELENVDMILSLMQDLHKENQVINIKVQPVTFLYMVEFFCATLNAERMIKIYEKIKLKKMDLNADTMPI